MLSISKRSHAAVMTALCMLAAVSCMSCSLERPSHPADAKCGEMPAESRLCGYDIGLSDDSGYLCSYGEWQEIMRCDNHMICAPDGDKFICVPDGQLCSDGEMTCVGMMFKQCDEGRWVTEACEQGYICDAEKGCVLQADPEKCEDGAYRCDDDVFQKCAGGQWKNETNCARSNMICDPVKKRCAYKPSTTCADGVKRCNGNIYQICENNAWTDAMNCDDQDRICIADSGCADKPVETCGEGAERCIGNMFQMCKDGIWTDSQNCADINLVCSETSGGCSEPPPAAECTGSEIMCDHNTYRKCKEGKWTETDCNIEGNICDKNHGCVECTIGDSICDGNILKKCIFNHWNKGKDCTRGSNGGICDPVKKACTSAVCDEGNIKCNGDSYSVCENGVWADGEDCAASGLVCEPNIGCVENKTPECPPGKTSCQNDKFMKCGSDKKWALEKDCAAAGLKCDDTTGCKAPEKACTPGEKKCDGDIFMSCGSDYKWTTEDCAAVNQSCSETGCSALPDCEEGQTRCSGNTYEICRTGEWKTEKKCSDSEVCVIGEGCTARCSDGDRRCTADRLSVEVCQNEHWVKTKCQGETPVCSDIYKDCVQCLPNIDVNNCKSINLLDVCTQGKSWEGSLCLDICEHSECGEYDNTCQDGQMKCSEPSNMGLSLCTDHTWTTYVCPEDACVTEAGVSYCPVVDNTRIRMCSADKRMVMHKENIQDNIGRSISVWAPEVTDSTEWLNQNYCDCIETDTDAYCRKCVDGDVKMSSGGSSIQKCVGGLWIASADSNVVCSDIPARTSEIYILGPMNGTLRWHREICPAGRVCSEKDEQCVDR